MDGLTGYQQRRLELADMIRAILPIARASSDEQREQQTRGLLTRLAAGRFQLAVIGQFSRGVWVYYRVRANALASVGALIASAPAAG